MWQKVRFDPTIWEEVPLNVTRSIQRMTKLPIKVFRSRAYPSYMYGIRRGGTLTTMGFLCARDECSPNPTPEDMKRIASSVRVFERRDAEARRGRIRDAQFRDQLFDRNYKRISAQYAIYRYLNKTKGQVRADSWLYHNGLSPERFRMFGLPA